MISVAEAQEIVLREARPLSSAAAELGPMALGLTLAEEVKADLDSPPFAKAMMDGFAVRSSDLSSQGVELAVVGEVFAGNMPRCFVAAGQCCRIMTGAPMPPGADAVVMLEKAEQTGDRVRFSETPKPGQNILPQGAEMKRGQVVLRTGTKLRPQELGVLASVGRSRFLAIRRPVVAILSTGDEVVEPALTPGPGKIRNSNATLLAALSTAAGAEPRSLGIAADTKESLRDAIRKGLDADVLLLSGGVSAGQLDLVPQALEEQGVSPLFHKVSLKPGKPLWFGTKDGKLVFGLPGNPVSSFVGFELFVRPALRAMRGQSPKPPTEAPATLATPLRHKGDRPTYHPCRVSFSASGLRAAPVKWLGSPDLLATAGGNAWLVLPAGDFDLRAEAPVRVLLPELDLD